MRSGLATAALICLACLVPEHASAWTSDTFRSPTGNLICRYHYAQPAITCGSFASQKIIHMRTYGRPLQGQRLSWADGTTWPVLRYGQTWNLGQPISCRSLSAGIRCQNTDGWFFLIDRGKVFVGRWGKLLYWL